jgi:geranylgeranyl diphosphate synthase, type II
MSATSIEPMKEKIADLVSAINQSISQIDFGQSPNELYEPITYLMDLGGKRMRPLLALLSYGLYKDDPHSILRPACAVEVFHNFTLMHDDIMDNAPLRRGMPTVHEKWNPNVAILSGDVMLVRAYDLLLDIPKEQLRQAIFLFNKTAAEVCEGQQWDMNFENYPTVTEAQYIEMIRLKTAVLLGFSLRLGAILAGASEKDQVLLESFGNKIGVGFQLKDDLLDVYADQEKFGKQVGGDIIANKKTFLLLKAIELAKGTDEKELKYWLNLKEFDKEEKVAAVKKIYQNLGIKELAEEKMNAFFAEGLAELDGLSAESSRKAFLKNYTEALIYRES